MAKSAESRFSIGVDYGTNSVRALVVDVADGAEIATQRVRLSQRRGGHPCWIRRTRIWPGRIRPTTSRASTSSVRRAVDCGEEVCAGFEPENVIGIGVDTTGSTPIPVDREGMPLALAAEVPGATWPRMPGCGRTTRATPKRPRSPPRRQAQRDRYLAKCGGTYSSEWYWSKILHCKRAAPKVFDAAYAWVELADFVPGVHHRQHRSRTRCRAASARPVTRRCTTTRWGGLPGERFLASLDPDLVDVRAALRPTRPCRPIRRRAS